MIAVLVIGVSLGLAVAMTGAWLVQWRTHNAGWVDVVWSFAVGAAGVAYALYPLQGAMPTPRQWLVAMLAAAWSLRLGLHIAGRTGHGTEDARYAQFRRDWGAAFQSRMFWFLQIQAAAAALLAVSMLLAARNPRRLSWVDGVALLVLLVAIAGRRWPTGNCAGFAPIPAIAGACSISGCGAGRGIRTTFSNGSAGWPIHCSRSTCAAIIPLAGWHFLLRPSCTGCWFTSRACRHWSSRCCGRGARRIGNTRGA